MLTKRGLRGAFLVAIFMTSSMVVQAGWLGRLNVFSGWRDRGRVDTLIITGNFGRSRVLAELVQDKWKHPIILVSPEANGQDELFFMPTRPEAEPLEQAKFVDFVEFLKPGRVIVLGDMSYVPARYVDQLRRSQIPTIVINSEDWAKNAESLARIIDYKGLPKAYAGYVTKLDMAKGGAVRSDAQAAPAMVPAPSVLGPGPMVAPMVVD